MALLRLAVFKFASCDGCQLSFLSLEDELLALADRLEIVHFLEATSRVEPGPYDVALVEGSITTPHDVERIRQVRRDAKFLVTIGTARRRACQGRVSTGLIPPKNLANRLRLARVHSDFGNVNGDRGTRAGRFELRGCPINKHQLLEVLTSLLAGRRPRTPVHSVCLEMQTGEAVRCA